MLLPTKSVRAVSVKLKDQNPSSPDKTTFLKKYTNKEKFVNFSVERLQLGGIKVVQCPSDGDATVVKIALQCDPITPFIFR